MIKLTETCKLYNDQNFSGHRCKSSCTKIPFQYFQGLKRGKVKGRITTSDNTREQAACDSGEPKPRIKPRHCHLFFGDLVEQGQ